MFEIGKRYEVPTVEGLFWGKWSLWPVMGPKHEDAAIIGFEPHHYHFDFRFFNPYQWTYVIQTGKEKYSQVLHEYTQTPLKPMQLRLRTCYRELPQYPTEGVPWLAKLNAAYAGHILGDDMICPHKGADLSTLPVVEGCITCPLHGLKWNLETRGLAAVVEIFA